jgi:arabinose-5-phosphate isomerase
MQNKEQILQIARQVFADEIAGIEQVRNCLDDNFADAVKLIYNCKGKIVVTGMGKSGHIGNKIAATMASTGTPAFFVHPAEALHGDLGMIDEKDVVIAISYSGESDELISILPIVKRRHVPMIGMTGNPESSLARISDCVLNIKIDKEACPLGLAPTTSTTACLVLGDALAVSLYSIKGFKPEDFALSHPGGSLGRRLLTRAEDLMHVGGRLPVVYADTLLKDVVMEISNKGLGLAGVVDEQNHLIGVVTDGDLRRLWDHKVDILSTRAGDFMTKSPLTVLAVSLAVEAVDLMEKKKITGFLVVDEDNKLVGAFNLHDLLKAKLL